MGSKIVSRSRSFFTLLITMQTDHKYQNIIIMHNWCFLGHCLRKEMVGRKLGRKINLRRNDWKKKISYIKHWFLGLAQVDRWLNLQPDSFICKCFPLQEGHFPAPPPPSWPHIFSLIRTFVWIKVYYYEHHFSPGPGGFWAQLETFSLVAVCGTFATCPRLGHGAAPPRSGMNLALSLPLCLRSRILTLLVTTLRLWNCPTASPLLQFQLLFKIMMGYKPKLILNLFWNLYAFYMPCLIYSSQLFCQVYTVIPTILIRSKPT